MSTFFGNKLFNGQVLLCYIDVYYHRTKYPEGRLPWMSYDHFTILPHLLCRTLVPYDILKVGNHLPTQSCRRSHHPISPLPPISVNLRPCQAMCGDGLSSPSFWRRCSIL